MNDGLKELYDNYLELSSKERIERSKQAAETLSTSFELSQFNGDEGNIFPKLVFALFIGSDLKVTGRECDIFNAVFDEDYDLSTLVAFVRKYLNEATIEEIDHITDNLPFELKNEVCIIGLSIISEDGVIEEREESLFEKILRNPAII